MPNSAAESRAASKAKRPCRRFWLFIASSGVSSRAHPKVGRVARKSNATVRAWFRHPSLSR
jgi:hypothetical protein